MKLIGDLLFEHFQARDMIIHSGDIFPADAEAGQLFFKTPVNELYIFNGITWNQVLLDTGSGGGGGSSGSFSTLVVTATTDLGRHIYIRDEMITLNYGESGAGVSQWGTTRAGIEIDRGSENTVMLYYDDTNDVWKLTNDGITEEIIVSSLNADYFIRLDGGNAPLSDISWGGHKITNLLDPTDPQDAATKNYVDAMIGSGIFLALDGSNSPTTDISWDNHKIIDLAPPTDPNDAVNYQTLQDEFTTSSGLGYMTYLRLDGSNSPSSDISWDSHKIIDLAPPTDPNDAVNYQTMLDGDNLVSLNSLHVDGSNSPTTDISWGGFRITSLADPIDPQDAVNRQFVVNNFATILHTHDYADILNRPPDDDFYVNLDEKATIDDNDYILIYSIADAEYMKVKRSLLVQGGSISTSNLDVWVIGGFDGSNYLSNVDAYNATADSWSALVSDMEAPTRAKFGAARISTDIYIAGGYNGAAYPFTDKYDIAVDSWVRETDMPSSAFDQVIVSNNTDAVYSIYGSSALSTYIDDNNTYDVTTNTWVSKTSAPEARSTASGGYINDRVYVAGGYNDTGYLVINRLYDVASDAWALASDLIAPARRDAAYGVVDNKLYLLGGYDGIDYLRNTVMYDPATDTWTDMADIPLPGRTDASGAVYNDKILLTNGFSGTYLRDADEYDPLTDSWNVKVDTPVPSRQDTGSA